MTPQRDNRLNLSALLRTGHKVSRVANLVGVSRTTVFAIKKRMDGGEGVNRRAGNDRKTVVDYDSLWECHSRNCFEWHPAICHDSQQYFDQFVFFSLLHACVRVCECACVCTSLVV